MAHRTVFNRIVFSGPSCNADRDLLRVFRRGGVHRHGGGHCLADGQGRAPGKRRLGDLQHYQAAGKRGGVAAHPRFRRAGGSQFCAGSDGEGYGRAQQPLPGPPALASGDGAGGEHGGGAL